MDSAEELFANQGYHGTTLRQLTQKAGVNLASVNYHHGNKESLYLETLRRRLRPINEARLRQLAEAETQAAGNPVPLAQIFQAFAQPVFMSPSIESNHGYAGQLIGRALSEPLPFTGAFVEKELQPTLARFAQALRLHDRISSPEDFLWRFSFVAGALHHSLATLHVMKSLTGGICLNNDRPGALHRFVGFAMQAHSGQPPARP